MLGGSGAWIERDAPLMAGGARAGHLPEASPASAPQREITGGRDLAHSECPDWPVDTRTSSPRTHFSSECSCSSQNLVFARNEVSNRINSTQPHLTSRGVFLTADIHSYPNYRREAPFSGVESEPLIWRPGRRECAPKLTAEELLSPTRTRRIIRGLCTTPRHR